MRAQWERALEGQGHGDPCSVAAMQVSQWACEGNKRAWKLAKEWAPRRQLLHPSTWSNWRGSSDADFEKALAIAVEELPELTQSQCQRESVVVFFASSPGKLMALARAGVDLNAAAAGRIPVAHLALRGDWQGLLGLARAGAEPPSGRVGGAKLPALAEPANALQAVLDAWGAMSRPGREKELSQGAKDAARWLSQGGRADVRDAQGLDALKRCVVWGFEQGARLAIELGARPLDLDAKGRNALEFLDEWARQQSKPSTGKEGQDRAAAALTLRPWLESVVERALLDRSSDWAPEARSKARSL